MATTEPQDATFGNNCNSLGLCQEEKEEEVEVEEASTKKEEEEREEGQEARGGAVPNKSFTSQKLPQKRDNFNKKTLKSRLGKCGMRCH